MTIAEPCVHQWYAWARGKRTPATQAIYCGECRVVLTEYLARLEAENAALKRHLIDDHGCIHEDAGGIPSP